MNSRPDGGQLFGREFAARKGMSEWTLRSLELPKYHIDGKWVDSTDPRGLVWVLDEVSGCTYDAGDMKFCVLTVYDVFKTWPPFEPSRKHPTPSKSQLSFFDPGRRFHLQVHDADDGYWDKYCPEFPADDYQFLLDAQPLSLKDLYKVFYQ
jgi:hypothetical protein